MSDDVTASPRPELAPTPLARSVPATVRTTTGAGVPVPPGYDLLVQQLRVLLDRVAAATPPAELVQDVAGLVEKINADLLPYATDEAGRLSGQLIDVPGRAQLLLPPYHVDELDDRRMTGRVRFGRQFLGSNGAVHGGAVPLLFDDVLGRLALVGDRTKSRTAYLHVDYRSIAPIEEELVVEGWFEREEGRKRHLRGVLRQGERVCAEVEGLFVALRAGQP